MAPTQYTVLWLADGEVISSQAVDQPGEFRLVITPDLHKKNISFRVDADGLLGTSVTSSATVPLVAKKSPNLSLQIEELAPPPGGTTYSTTVADNSKHTYTLKLVDSGIEVSDYSGVVWEISGEDKDAFSWDPATRTLSFTQPVISGGDNDYSIVVFAAIKELIGDEVKLEIAVEGALKPIGTALVAMADQTKVLGDAPFPVTHTGGNGSAGGALTYSSDNTSVATVDGSGNVTLVGVGTANITITEAASENFNGQSASFRLTVLLKPIGTALVAMADQTKVLGDAPFPVTHSGGNGAAGGALTYSSDNTSVATVDGSGNVTLVGVGTANITITEAASENFNGQSASFRLTVLLKPIGIMITGDATVGTELISEVDPAGATMAYQWQSSSDAVTYEDIPGATAETYTLAPGDEGKYFRVVATGTDPYTGTLTSNSIGPVTMSMYLNSAIVTGDATVGSLLVTTLDPSAAEATATYVWESSPDDVTWTPTGATSQTYTLAPGDEGKYFRVVATGTGGYTGTAISDSTARVKAIAPQILSYSPTSGTKTYGDAAFMPTLTGQTAGGSVAYKSSNTDVAKVDSSGKVTIDGAGLATISAMQTHPNYADQSATYLLTVHKAIAPPTLSYSPTSGTKTYGDAAFMPTLTGQTAGGTVTYKSSNTDVAKVDSSGKVTIDGAGLATITATQTHPDYADQSATYLLTVSKAAGVPLTAASKTISPDINDYKVTVSGGNGGKLTYSVVPTNGTPVCTIDASSGLVSPTGAIGASKIRVNESESENYIAQSKTVTITVTFTLPSEGFFRVVKSDHPDGSEITVYNNYRPDSIIIGEVPINETFAKVKEYLIPDSYDLFKGTGTDRFHVGTYRFGEKVILPWADLRDYWEIIWLRDSYPEAVPVYSRYNGLPAEGAWHAPMLGSIAVALPIGAVTREISWRPRQ